MNFACSRFITTVIVFLRISFRLFPVRERRGKKTDEPAAESFNGFGMLEKLSSEGFLGHVDSQSNAWSADRPTIFL